MAARTQWGTRGLDEFADLMWQVCTHAAAPRTEPGRNKGQKEERWKEGVREGGRGGEERGREGERRT